MKSFAEITKEELIDLENRCWMTHDGMWFFICLSNFGIEQANKLNKSAIRGLAPFEIERTKKPSAIKKKRCKALRNSKIILLLRRHCSYRPS